MKSQDNAAEDSNKKKDPYADLLNFADRERLSIAGTTPGSIYKVDVDNSHPLMFGYPKYYYTLKMDAAVYEFIKDGGWNVGTLKKENQVAGFVGYTYLTDNVLFRDFWENGKLMMCNAVFLVGQ